MLWRLTSKREVFIILCSVFATHMVMVSLYSQPRTTTCPLLPPLYDDDSYPHSNYLAKHESPPTVTQTSTVLATPSPPIMKPPFMSTFQPTSIMHHTPGWTIYRNLYMANGTFYVVTDSGGNSGFPDINMTLSKGQPIPETASGWRGADALARQPTSEEMSFLSTGDAVRMWGKDLGTHVEWRVWNVEGNTILLNDAPQYLHHYYHFVAELWFGISAFWQGAFSRPTSHPASASVTYPFLTQDKQTFNPRKPSSPYWIHHNEPNPNTFLNYTYRPADYHILQRGELFDQVPPIDRFILMRSDWKGWRDVPLIDPYFLRAAYPSITVEHKEDWEDRVRMTVPPPGQNNVGRAWRFPVAMLVDRSAAINGDICGLQNQRTAAQPWEYMFRQGRLRGWKVGGWWETVRSNVLQFGGLPVTSAAVQMPTKAELGAATKDGSRSTSTLDTALPLPLGRPVITYISRQHTDWRSLRPDAHDGLIKALTEVAKKRNCEFQLVDATKIGKDEQIRIASRTTFMIGVHGNGLSHLLWMRPTRYATVIEIFWPGRFRFDYQWTARALGMRHWSVHNNTYYSHPNAPASFMGPESEFQSNKIPVHGPTVAEIIEHRLDGKI